MATIDTYMPSSNQSFYDISMQHFGTAEYAFEIAAMNKLIVSDRIDSGVTLKLPNVAINSYVLNAFKSRDVTPATDFFTKIQEEAGIDNWQIEVDFVVSENID